MISFIILTICYLVAKDYVIFGNSYKDVTAYEAKELIKTYPNLKIIDISGIYNLGHIPGSINLFIGDGTLDRALTELNKNDRYLVYYHSNNKSIEAAMKLKDIGIRKVYRLDGNFHSWVAAGFETSSL
jgi:rhodanese-related sulfurtransferase